MLIATKARLGGASCPWGGGFTVVDTTYDAFADPTKNNACGLTRVSGGFDSIYDDVWVAWDLNYSVQVVRARQLGQHPGLRRRALHVRARLVGRLPLTGSASGRAMFGHPGQGP